MFTMFFLCVALCIGISGDLIKKVFNLRYGSEATLRCLFMTTAFAVGTVTLLLAGGVNFTDVSSFTLGLGVIFGIFTAVITITHMLALNTGPYAYTAVIISFATLIPTFSGAIFWEEQVYPIQFLGIFLMLICFVLSTNSESSQTTHTSKWLFYCFLTFCLNGSIALMQKWHQSTPYKEELSTFILIAFASASVSSLLMSLIQIKKEAETPCLSGKWIYLALFAGIAFGLNNKMTLYLSGIMDSAVFFPVYNVGALLLNTFSGIVIFREKLSKRQIVGIAVGIVSVLCLCNPFA